MIDRPKRKCQKLTPYINENQKGNSKEFDYLNWSNFGSVSIKPSKVVPGKDTGMGLFANTLFQKDDVITEYSGIVMDYEKIGNIADQTHDAALPLRECDGLIIRGFKLDNAQLKKHTTRALGQIANDARSQRNNSS
jgi:hypothetical protein